jgi:putative tryptophan/tyrosine transport system substrate-binding protein
MTVRIFLTVLAVLVWAAAAAIGGDTAPVHPEQPTVVIVTSSAVEAFEDTVAGIRRGLGPGVNAIVVDLTAKPETPVNPLAAKEARLFITVGNNALEHAAQAGKSPVIATMILRADLGTQRLKPPVGAVVLDLPFAEVLLKVAKIFPGKTRVGIVRNPDSWSAPAVSLAAQAKTAGMTLTVVDCAGPEHLMQSFRSLRNRVDFVWAPPDGALYNSSTVRPLIRASLENRLPVVGFSASFVRTGAAAGVYPDYFEVGLQAGEMARNYLGGASLLNESPRKIRVAANPRVARLLGLRPFLDGELPPGIVVIQ